ncbi:MAG: M43 family zinc metalloprotease [Bacteroidota bacterium]|nr:M43 family zinc metalloprotease [Bacteroidota bacterium]
MKYVLFSFWLMLSTGISAQDLHIQAKELPCLNKHFTIKVHIFLDSLGNTNFNPSSLDGPIQTANQFFSPICLSFSICEIDTIKNYNFDRYDSDTLLGEILSKHYDARKINVYLLKFVKDDPSCGIAALAGVNNPNRAYIFLDKDCPSALSHELGHFFGLLHTFEGNGRELANGSNCATEGDLICDTPADPFIEKTPLSRWIKDCEFIHEGLDPNGHYYIPHTGNIMSYYGCDCGFTRDQYLKMAATYHSGIKKLW